MTLIEEVRIWLPAMAVIIVVGVTTSKAGNDAEEKFLAENNVAMSKMMTDMAVPSSGDVDRDFVAMMVPHHQGAVDMALAELRYGHNEQLRRIAQEIVVDQPQEIAAMNLAIGRGPVDSQAGRAPMAAMPMKSDATSTPGKP
jgi:hypothetical protein